MCPKSNHIAVFALDLKPAYEGEHAMFGLLSLADLSQIDVLGEIFLTHFLEKERDEDKPFARDHSNTK
jgi:hypothetical protein